MNNNVQKKNGERLSHSKMVREAKQLKMQFLS